MFSIFDYLRRRTCDAFLAGAYDAMEVLQSDNFKLPAPTETSAGSADSPPHNVLAGQKNGAAPKILPLAAAKPVAEQKTPPPAEKNDAAKPSAPTPKPASQTPSAPAVPPSSPADLFAADSRREEPLPPRRRGRPRKNPPDGNLK